MPPQTSLEYSRYTFRLALSPGYVTPPTVPPFLTIPATAAM